MEPASPSPSEEARPSRLPFLTHFLAVLLPLLSFLSGLMIWVGQPGQDLIDPLAPETAAGGRAWLVLHGALNPVMCGLFGYLLCQHIRYGWERRVNRATGFVMELVFAVLIVTGAGLYYGPEAWREEVIWTHRVTGLALPVSLALHWVAAQIWVRKSST